MRPLIETLPRLECPSYYFMAVIASHKRVGMPLCWSLIPTHPHPTQSLKLHLYYAAAESVLLGNGVNGSVCVAFGRPALV